jgi:glutamyl-tRNA synthetase
MYNGHFILRYEDTSAEVKPPIPEMYDAILEDLDWLGVKVDEIFIQSDRLEIYYKYAEKIIQEGNAYVCNCNVEEFRKLYMKKKACPCRNLDPEKHLERWKKMLDGRYQQGEAVVRIKTDLNDPNPAVRDWPALRISETWHPRQGNKYRVWPLYNFSCGIDDHLMEVSHIIRGKEHDVNTIRQRWLQKHLGWQYPEIINIGRLGLEAGILSKSKIRTGIENATYTGWDDPRLGTLKSLRKRGIQPQAIRNIMIHVGPKPVNVSISWDNFASENRQIIEPISNRYSFVENPIQLIIKKVKKTLLAYLPLHPDYPERGNRTYILEPIKDEIQLNIPKNDLSKIENSKIIRLMGIANIKIINLGNVIEAEYHSEDYRYAREVNAPFINWLPYNSGVDAKVIMSDASEAKGLAEELVGSLKPNDIIQFERFGYCRIDKINPFTAYFTHI